LVRGEFASQVCVSEWLGRLRLSTRRLYLHYFHSWYVWLQEYGNEFGGKTLEELLDLQDRATGRGKYRLLSLVQKWLGSGSGSESLKRLKYCAVRSFFMHNHCDFPNDVSFQVRGDYPTVEGEMSVQDLRKILLAANRTYRAVFHLMYSCGMSEEDLLHFSGSWPEVCPQLERGDRMVSIRSLNTGQRETIHSDPGWRGSGRSERVFGA